MMQIAQYTENPNSTLAFAMAKSCCLTRVDDAQMAKKCTLNDKQDDTTFQIMDCVFTHGLELTPVCPPMWQAEADTELTLPASSTTVVGQKALALAKRRHSTVLFK